MERLKLIKLVLILSIFSVTKFVGVATVIAVHIAEPDSDNSMKEYNKALDKANELGIKIIRIPTDWNALEEIKGEYNPKYIKKIKERVAHAQKLGQKVIMMLSQSPIWANGKKSDKAPKYPPKRVYYDDFANAMIYIQKELINPFDKYDIDINTIIAWEVWNEPNALEFWRPDDTEGIDSRKGTEVLVPLDAAKEYAELLKVTYNKMKKAFPYLTILGGSLASGDADYLKELYKDWGGKAYFDHLALHPYSGPDTRGDKQTNPHYSKAQYPNECFTNDSWCFKRGIENIRKTLDSYGDNDKEIWITEYGASSDDRPDAWVSAGSKAEQKKHLQIALDILLDWANDNDKMKIPVATIYKLKDEGDDYFGILNEDYTQKPAANYLKSVINNFSNADQIEIEEPEIVLWPPKDFKDAQPTYFNNDSPSPLAKECTPFGSSGTPINIQFYTPKSTDIEYDLFELRDSNGKLLTVKKVNTDLNIRKFAFFPLQRLHWDTTYKALFRYREDDDPKGISWHFKTKKAPYALLVLNSTDKVYKVAKGAIYTQYLPPKSCNDVSEGVVSFDEKKIAIIDEPILDRDIQNIKIVGRVGDIFSTDIDNKTFTFKIFTNEVESLTFSDITTTSVTLHWKHENGPNDTGYKIYRNNTLVYTASKNERTYTDTGLAPNTTYKYTIKVTDD